VATEFAERAGIVGSPAGRLAPRLLSTSAEQVAEQGYRGLMRGRRVVVPGVANRLVTFIVPFVPRRLLLSLVRRRQARRREADDA